MLELFLYNTIIIGIGVILMGGWVCGLVFGAFAIAESSRNPVWPVLYALFYITVSMSGLLTFIGLK